MVPAVQAADGAGAVPAGYFAAFNANVCYGTGVIAEKPDIVPSRRYLHVGQAVAVAAEFPAERHGFRAYRGERSSRKLDISGKDVISAPLRIVPARSSSSCSVLISVYESQSGEASVPKL